MQLLAEATMPRGWALAEQGQVAERAGADPPGRGRLAGHRGLSMVAIIWLAWLGRMGTWGSRKQGSACWPRRWRQSRLAGNVSRRPSCFGSKASCCWRSLQSITRQAASCFQQALAVARRQQAKSWELRAAMSLSRLWQQQGKRAEAYQLLAQTYGWFTEGFDTADLREAKGLLEALP